MKSIVLFTVLFSLSFTLKANEEVETIFRFFKKDTIWKLEINVDTKHFLGENNNYTELDYFNHFSDNMLLSNINSEEIEFINFDLFQIKDRIYIVYMLKNILDNQLLFTNLCFEKYTKFSYKIILNSPFGEEEMEFITPVKNISLNIKNLSINQKKPLESIVSPKVIYILLSIVLVLLFSLIRVIYLFSKEI